MLRYNQDASLIVDHVGFRCLSHNFIRYWQDNISHDIRAWPLQNGDKRKLFGRELDKKFNNSKFLITRLGKFKSILRSSNLCSYASINFRAHNNYYISGENYSKLRNNSLFSRRLVWSK